MEALAVARRPSPSATTRGAPQVVWTRLVADLETPVSAYLKLAGGKTVEASTPPAR